MILTLSDIYRDYVLSGGTVSKSVFKNVCQDFNLHITNMLIEGDVFYMPYEIGSFSVVWQTNDYTRIKIHWGKTNAYKKELIAKGEKLWDAATKTGKKYFVYDTSDLFTFLYWKKSRDRATFIDLYRFRPTRGRNGLVVKLSALRNADPLYYLRFRKSPKEEKLNGNS